jgi:uncharacterized membrane protein
MMYGEPIVERKEARMELIVVSFDHLEDARKTMKALRDLEGQGHVRFEDTALIERDSDGTAHVRNEVSGTTEAATVIGAFIGGVVTFAFPIAGIAIGAALGAAIGAAMDTGVSREFAQDVKDKLQPGKSALFLVVKQADLDPLIAALRQFHGEILQTTLPIEEEALRR